MTFIFLFCTVLAAGVEVPEGSSPCLFSRVPAFIEPASEAVFPLFVHTPSCFGLGAVARAVAFSHVTDIKVSGVKVLRNSTIHLHRSSVKLTTSENLSQVFLGFLRGVKVGK